MRAEKCLLIIVSVVVFALVFSLYLRLAAKERHQEEAWKNARVVLVTKQGQPADYHGYRVLYEKAASSGNFVITMSVNGRRVIIDPGEHLDRIRWDEKGWGFSSCVDGEKLSRFAFYLPNGEKLRLKAVSSDLLDLYWAKEGKGDQCG